MAKITKVKCSCCGKELLAEIRDDKMIIMDKRHGRRHLVVITLEDILSIMQQGLNLPAKGLNALNPVKKLNTLTKSQELELPPFNHSTI
jgi:hypothetical protein